MERYFCICTLDSKPSNSALEGALMKVDKFDHDLNTFIALILHEILLSVLEIAESQLFGTIKRVKHI